jgi:reverse gyrase
MLQTFVEGHSDDLFLRADLKVKGFVCKVSEPKESPIGTVKLYSLYYREEADVKEQARVKQTKKSALDKIKESTQEPVYEQLLDEKILPNVKESELLAVYVVNPDYYIIFGDLITEILECIRDWRKTGAGAVVTDYESGRIGYL